ncbi:hypothetical protein [Longimicrobium sp.]|jgi:hypothetical protein|uniref:hypothetical protein n=1 Tax=Longimicrobium sp. TaxID=2029185 RepID=UPI002ED80A85
MRYDEGYGRGYGRHDGWEYRMPPGGRGYDRGYRQAGGPWNGERPWVGGYREGYQGGSGGYPIGGGPRYLDDNGGRADHEHGYRRPRGQQGGGGRDGTYFFRGRAGYGGDFHAGSGGHGTYDDPRSGTGFSGRGGYARDFGGRGGGYGRDFGARGGYGGDFNVTNRGRNDEHGARREFQNEGRPEGDHPRYSPVGGTWRPMGGSYLARPDPRDVEDVRWTSETTRWF